jgi:DUF4097 and DUF4098 domain-containing protein YvlB
MSKLLKAFLVVAGLWLLFILVVGSVGATLFNVRSFLPNLININESAQRTETLSHSAQGIAILDVRTRNGSVTVSNGESEEISIKANYTARAESSSRAATLLNSLKTNLTVVDGVLRVEGDFGSGTFNNQTIAYEISVPKGLDLVVRTSNGSINVYELVGSLRLETSNGSIDISSASGPEEIDAKTSNGRITVKGAPEGGLYDLRTSNGTVTVSLPQEVGIGIEATTSNGSINLGSGQWTMSGGQISNKNVKATRGDGSLTLRITTSNGNVRIEDR